MKSPPQQFTDDEAHRKLEAFIRGGDEVPAAAAVEESRNGVAKRKRRNGARMKR